MADLFLDIETVPIIDPVKFSSEMEISAPANYKKEDAISNYIATKRAELASKLTKDASLNPVYGRVVSVAMRYKGLTFSCCSDYEPTVIGYIYAFICKQPISWGTDRLITYNGKAFDQPFINIRAGYELLPNVPKYDQRVHFDAYLYISNFGAFSGGNLSMSQSAVAKQLGVPPVAGSGADVYGWYTDGRFDQIKKYNIEDVKQLEAICNKIGIKNERMPI
ncbi:MAG: ribonuclease H-like domain-containing protein [Desulfobacteraceae bacterium]|jgi:hypothetical protein